MCCVSLEENKILWKSSRYPSSDLRWFQEGTDLIHTHVAEAALLSIVSWWQSHLYLTASFAKKKKQTCVTAREPFKLSGLISLSTKQEKNLSGPFLL